MKKSEDLLTKTQIKERGWTEKMISKFLPVPDKESQNPNWAAGTTMKLYHINRITEAETYTEFAEAKAKAETRRQAAKKGNATIFKNMLDYLDCNPTAIAS